MSKQDIVSSKEKQEKWPQVCNRRTSAPSSPPGNWGIHPLPTDLDRHNLVWRLVVSGKKHYMTDNHPPKQRDSLNRERYQLLRWLGRLLEVPMAVLGLLWLVLIIIDLTKGLSPFQQTISTGI